MVFRMEMYFLQRQAVWLFSVVVRMLREVTSQHPRTDESLHFAQAETETSMLCLLSWLLFSTSSSHPPSPSSLPLLSAHRHRLAPLA